nr:MAG TPA: hypothetical protein [Caudoviricetes sp.]
MEEKLEYEIQKLNEIQARYHQVLDIYRGHIREDIFSAEDEEAYQKVSKEWHEQLTKIRDLANDETSYDQWLDDQKEQAEDGFVLTEEAEESQNNNNAVELEYVSRRLILRCEGLADLCKEKQWYTKGTADQYAKLLQIEDKENVTLKDAVEAAQDIHKHSSRGTLEEIMEAILCRLKAYYIDDPEEKKPPERMERAGNIAADYVDQDTLMPAT